MSHELSAGNEERLRKLLHDLRNRLNNIAMNAELAKLEMGSLEPAASSVASSSSSEVLACLANILVACKESADVVEGIARCSLPEAS